MGGACSSAGSFHGRSFDKRQAVGYNRGIMWETFKKAQHTGQKPAVSVTPRGFTINKAAILLLVKEIPDSDLDFVVLIDREACQIGVRLYVAADDGDPFMGRRPRQGKKRRPVNTWRVGVGAVIEARLQPGRYEACLHPGQDVTINPAPGPAMIVFGPKPLES